MNYNVTCPIVSMENCYYGNLGQMRSYTDNKFGNVRSITVEGNPYFFLRDICISLGIEYTHEIINRLLGDLDRRNSTQMNSMDTDQFYTIYPPDYYLIDTPSGKSAVLSEPAMYYIILNSKTRNSFEFQNWLYHVTH